MLELPRTIGTRDINEYGLQFLKAYTEGTVVDVTEAQGKLLIEHGFAVLVDPAKPKAEAKPVPEVKPK